MSAWLALLALTTQAAEPESYRAIGTAPLWQAWVYAEAMTFETPGRDRIMVQRPARQATEGGFVYRGDGLSLAIRHGDCTDPLSGRVFADRVTVEQGGARFEGCGGAPRSAGSRDSYGAAGGEPFWSLEIADGRLYFGVNDDVWIVPAPPMVVARDPRTRTYSAPGLRVTLRQEECGLEDERTYADRVTVSAGPWRVEGCGGRVVREAPGD